MTYFELLLVAAVAIPGALFLLLSVTWLLGAKFSERGVVLLTSTGFSLSTLALLTLAVGQIGFGIDAMRVPLGDWFRVGDYSFSIDLLADRLSLPMMVLTAVLTGLVAAFSAKYLHRERGFLYFFLLLQLFGFGSLLLFSAASFDLLVGGWELVGLTSVLLIGFFFERRGPVENGLRVFAVYRTCDIGLLTAVVALHHYLGSAKVTTFAGDWPHQTTSLDVTSASLIAGLLLFAAMGKAAQFPFSSWLPRAMEGPTPSSAIFYGAISVHAGAYLLLRAQPLLEASPIVSAATIAVGILSAVFAILIGRASTDIKTSLAYASVAQLGLIFVEIGFGFQELAVWHICGHAVVRTLQILRSPSALHEFHQLHAAAGGNLQPVGEHHEVWLSPRIRRWLYRMALERGYLDTFLDRFVAGPLLAASRLLNPRNTPPPPSPSTRQRTQTQSVHSASPGMLEGTLVSARLGRDVSTREADV